MTDRFQSAALEKSRLEAESKRAVSTVRLCAELRSQPVPWPGGGGLIAVAVVKSKCCGAEMGRLTNGRSPEDFVWIRPPGWTESEEDHFRATSHARHALAKGITPSDERSRQRADHPYRLHLLPILLDCPTCRRRQWLRADVLQVPSWLGLPWTGPSPPYSGWYKAR